MPNTANVSSAQTSRPDVFCMSLKVTYGHSHLEPDMSRVSLTVNGKPATAEVEGRTLLVHLLREHLKLTGTHVGCDTTQCGCCTVHLNGKGVKSCTVLAASCEGSTVTTIEGIATNGKLHPMQEAFREHHALQCGFCTPGMIMSALEMV